MLRALAHACRAIVWLVVPLLILTACEGAPDVVAPRPDLAKPGGGGPTVKSTDPASGPRNTTLDVRVLGSGFKADAEAVWALGGDTTYATTRIRTNLTRFVSSGELVANITISTDAELALFDVMVVLTGNGKKGIGIELFEVTYEQIDLGFGAGSQAFGVNDRGQVVGWGLTSDGTRALLWENGVVTDLGVLPGMTGSLARGINESGHVVGYSWRFENGVSVERGFVWTPGGGIVELATLGGTSGQARAINELGHIVGHSMLPGDAVVHATLWRAGVPTDLHAGAGSSRAADVNDDGVVVGWTEAGLTRSFRWTEASGLEYLRPPGTSYGDAATGVNALGRIVGVGEPSPGQTPRGYLWTDGALQSVPGDSQGSALALNDIGQVVGHHLVSVGGGRKAKAVQVFTAYVWNGVGAPRNLTGDRQPRHSFAYDVNGRGWAVGDAEFGSDGARATLWRIR